MPKLKEYHTPLEEILDIVESTNDIVSNILQRYEKCCSFCFQDCKFGVKEK
jgi:hypothetical protein